MQTEMEARVAAYMRSQQMAEAGDTIAVALSGGADSVCLFRLLLRLQEPLSFTLRAVHINHGLRPEADAEEQWVRELCERYQVPLQCFSVPVREKVQQEHGSVEEAARELRYAMFEKVQADRIALAHHRRDQAETVLQHLLRGSGLLGLGGMRPVRGRYIRPLLEESPESLRQYNQELGQTWLEDASNQDLCYQRNRIRHQLLPELAADYNPAIEERLGQMAALLQEDEAYLEEQACRALERVRASEGLRVSELMALPPAIAGRVLRRFVAEQGGLRNLSAEHVEQIRQLCRGSRSKRINLPEGLTLIRSYDILKTYETDRNSPLIQPIGDLPAWVSCPGQEDGIGLEWTRPPRPEEWKKQGSEEEWIRVERSAPLQLRTRQAGDYIIAAGGRKRLQDYMVDAKIPTERRDVMLLLTTEQHVLWIPHYRLSDGARITEDTQEVLHAWICTQEEYENRPLFQRSGGCVC